MKHHFTLVRRDSRYWIIFLLVGVVFMITGCYSLFYPFAKHASVARIIGLLALITGVSKVLLSVKQKQEIVHLQRHLAVGIANTLVGIFLVSYQGISMLILPFLLSFWVLSGSIALIDEVTDIDIHHTKDVDWLLVGMVLTVVAFLLTAYLPVLGSLTAILAAAVFLIVIGLFYVFLALRLRRVKKEFESTGSLLSQE